MFYFAIMLFVLIASVLSAATALKPGSVFNSVGDRVPTPDWVKVGPNLNTRQVAEENVYWDKIYFSDQTVKSVQTYAHWPFGEPKMFRKFRTEPPASETACAPGDGTYFPVLLSAISKFEFAKYCPNADKCTAEYVISHPNVVAQLNPAQPDIQIKVNIEAEYATGDQEDTEASLKVRDFMSFKLIEAMKLFAQNTTSCTAEHAINYWPGGQDYMYQKYVRTESLPKFFEFVTWKVEDEDHSFSVHFFNVELTNITPVPDTTGSGACNVLTKIASAIAAIIISPIAGLTAAVNSAALCKGVEFVNNGP